jgi:hypothetical protein
MVVKTISAVVRNTHIMDSADNTPYYGRDCLDLPVKSRTLSNLSRQRRPTTLGMARYSSI